MLIIKLQIKNLPQCAIQNAIYNCIYCNNPKFSYRQVWTNSVDPDQTAPRSGSALFAILSAHFG